MTTSSWQLELGAQALDGGRARFRVWAPAARSVEVEVYPWPEGIVRYPLAHEGDGVWGAVADARAGWLYRYRLDGEWAYPDPYSRSQPEGVHGPAQIVDPRSFRWTDDGWRGPDPESLVIYEVHVGTYTLEGTFDALIGQLDEIARLGVSAIELMPVVEFPGRWNWGYDGVDLFSPSSVYGGPDGLRRLVDAAHARGLAIILDIVYNHLGPDGNYLHVFSPDYFTDRYQTPWGDAVNFDGPDSSWVRRYFVDNALYWLHEYHIDGLRLDATHRMYDASPKHILRELAEAVDERGPSGRRCLLMAEDEPNDVRVVLPRAAGGYGFDGLWVDDFHHSVHVLLTNEDRGYLKGYEGTVEEIVRLLCDGFLYWLPPPQDGFDAATMTRLAPAHRLVYCLQNHDQVGNRPYGRRLAQLVDMEPLKAAVALLLLIPCTPMIFMGAEFGSSTPFLYFADHGPELAEQIRAGRFRDFRDFWASVDPARFPVPDPQDEDTFVSSRLDLSEREQPGHTEVYQLYRELLSLRRNDPVLSKQDRARMQAQAIGSELLGVLRWDDEGRRRLLLVNFGGATRFALAEQAWLGEAAQLAWRPLLSTAEQRFAGPGADLSALPLRPGAAVELPPHCAVLCAADGL